MPPFLLRGMPATRSRRTSPDHEIEIDGHGGGRRGYRTGVRIVVVGASGNVGTAVGTALLRRLRSEPDVDLVGIARRVPGSAAGEPSYAPTPKTRFVDESWPTTGVPGSSYSRDKADVEAPLAEVHSVALE